MGSSADDNPWPPTNPELYAMQFFKTTSRAVLIMGITNAVYMFVPGYMNMLW